MEKVISIVGAGGKTTLVHKLAREYHRSGKGVLVTTTTHMYVEADTDLSCDFFALRDKIIKDGYCMAGQKISEQSKPKMCGLPYDLLDRLIKDMPQALDYVIIEADGAKHHSLKYPAADEPRRRGQSTSLRAQAEGRKRSASSSAWHSRASELQ